MSVSFVTHCVPQSSSTPLVSSPQTDYRSCQIGITPTCCLLPCFPLTSFPPAPGKCPFESQAFHLCLGLSLDWPQIYFIWPTHFMFKIFEFSAFSWSIHLSVLIPTCCIMFFFICVIFLVPLSIWTDSGPISIDLKVKTNSSLFFS